MNEPEAGRPQQRGGDEAAVAQGEPIPGVPEEIAEGAMSPLAKTVVAAVLGLAVVWFFVSWIVLNSTVRDAVSEAFGGIMLLLLLVSIAGAVMGAARRSG